MDFYQTLVIIAGLCARVQCNLELVWPLNNYTYTAEIANNASNQDKTAGCNLVFQSDRPAVFYLNSVFLDGTSFTDVVVQGVSSAFDRNDYTFSGWFKTSTDNGTLFHYKGDNEALEFQSFKATIEARNIRVTRILKSGTEHSTFTFMLNLNTWYFISVGIDVSKGSVTVEIIDENDESNKEDGVDNNYIDNIDMSVPGMLRIGGTFDGSDPLYHGLVTCIALHSSRVPTETDSRDVCLGSTQSDYYLPVCAERKFYMGFYVSYNATTASLHAINQSKACSVFECGLRCLNEKECKYFQFKDLGTCTTCFMWKKGTDSSYPPNGEMYELEYTL